MLRWPSIGPSTRVADLEDAEAELLLTLVFRGEGRWTTGAPPLALAYCGFADAPNQALVYETKNAAGDCADFVSARETGPAWRKDCVHQVEPEGIARYSRDMKEMGAADPVREVVAGQSFKAFADGHPGLRPDLLVKAVGQNVYEASIQVSGNPERPRVRFEESVTGRPRV